MNERQRIKELVSWETYNGFSVADDVRTFRNCETAEVDEWGDIWIEGPMEGHWMDDDELSDFLLWLDTEVNLPEESLMDRARAADRWTDPSLFGGQ